MNDYELDILRLIGKMDRANANMDACIKEIRDKGGINALVSNISSYKTNKDPMIASMSILAYLYVSDSLIRIQENENLELTDEYKA